MASKGNTTLNSEASEAFVEEHWEFDKWVYEYGTNFNEHFKELIPLMRELMEPSKDELYRFTYPTMEELRNRSPTKYSQLQVGDTVPFTRRDMSSFSYDKQNFQNFVVDDWVLGSRKKYFEQYPTLDILVAPKGTPNFPLDGVPFAHQSETFVPSENWVVKKIETTKYKDYFPPSLFRDEDDQKILNNKPIRLIYIEQEDK